MTYYLGIDLGGTVVKASVFDRAGVEAGSCGKRTRLISRSAGQAERDVDETRRLTLEAIGGALKSAGVKGGDVAAVATTGHGKGVYIVNRDGGFGPGIISTDTRSIEVSNRFHAHPDFDRQVYRRTLQPLWPAHTATILVWLKETQRESYDRIGKIMLAKDLLRFFLTDDVATERTDVSGTGLWNNVEDRLDLDVLDFLGIPEIADAIPTVHASHAIAGTVSASAAAATGLSQGTPVVGGLFDVNACALATGLQNPDELAAVVGTWSISEFVTRDISAVQASGERYVIQAHCVPDYWMIHEASPTSASNLEWFIGTLLPDIAEEERFDYCNTVVAGTPDSDVTFFPFLFGDDLGANATGTLWGLRAGTTRDQIIRGIYEGVVFQHARHLNRLLKLVPGPRQIRFAGGATRSDVWMQLFADTLGTPVSVSPATELGALGAAICAAVGVHDYGSFADAMSAMTGTRHTFTPVAARFEELQQKQQRFDRAVSDMAPVWSRYAPSQ